MNLLIVEDNEQMRRMVRSLVADLVDGIFECGDVAGALSVYAEHRPDWVLMDIELPEVDGINAALQIKTAYPEARVIIMTSYNDASLRESAWRAGACEYLVKENLLDLRRILTARVNH